jgi:pimeloyl-ACP methyl ester carboxylesterase
LQLSVSDPDRPTTQRELDWADEQDARDPQKREQHRLRVFVGVSGWLSSSSDVSKPWEVIESGTTEPFALRFELDAMLRLGNSLNDVLFGYAFDGVTYTVVSRTLLGALYAGLWPLGLVKAASVLDNPFSVALARADKAGKVLAHALIDGVQGKRPVTLTGYSVGARVVYACLIELAEQHAFGLVESAVLMGTPAPANPKRWRQIRSVVAGRIINVYSTEDYVLGFLYRSTKLQVGVAGLQKVEDVHGVENFDVSKLVSGHDRYRYLVGTILVKVGFGDVDFNKVAEQERALEEAEKRKTRAQKEAKRKAANERAKEPMAEPRNRPVPTTQDSSNSLIDLSEPVPTAAPTRNSELSGLSLVSAGVQEHPLSNVDASASVLPAKPLLDRSRSIPSNTTTLLPDLNDNVGMENAAVRLQKKGLDVAVTEVLVLGGSDTAKDDSTGNEHQDEFDDYDYDAEEVSSEFGELSMVEPLPMDDNDYGLM